MTDQSDELSIGQVAERTGLSVHALRFYEREGIFLSPIRRAAGGRRVYTEDDVDWLTLCTILRGAAMPLDDIRRYTELVRAGDGNEPERLALLRRHEERVREQQHKLDRCLDLTRFKIGVYEDILAGDTAPAEDKASLADEKGILVMSEGTPHASGPDDVPANGDDRPAFDTSVAHQARIYDYWLGGKDNYAADRKAAEEAIAAYPGVVTGARANRQFLARAVRHLAADAGIRQFLDIGTGIPTANNTHEVAQAVAPGSRVVYVDYDPVVLAHARALLTSREAGATEYIDADLRDTDTILEQASQTLDFSQPVAIMLIAIMHAIGDVDPYQIVAKLMDAVPPGSHLVLSHVASDIDPEQIAEATARLNQLSRQHFTLRDHAQVLRFFKGLELLEPGVVRVEKWRASELETQYQSAMWGGMGRKP